MVYERYTGRICGKLENKSKISIIKCSVSLPEGNNKA